MKIPVSWILALLAGGIVLLGYFIPGAAALREIPLQWAVGIAAFALLVGVANLLSVHGRKIRDRQKGSLYSAILILAFAVTLVLAGWSGPAGGASLWIFNYVQLPVEASLMAVLAVVLVYACARLLRRRANTMAWIFVITVLLVLLGTAPLYFLKDIPAGLDTVRAFLVQTLATAGARGILLGVALGTMAAGARILLGADRPYGG